MRERCVVGAARCYQVFDSRDEGSASVDAGVAAATPGLSPTRPEIIVRSPVQLGAGDVRSDRLVAACAG